MTVLAVSALAKSFGGVHALSDVSFAVRAGQLLAMIGPNGAGKTQKIPLDPPVNWSH